MDKEKFETELTRTEIDLYVDTYHYLATLAEEKANSNDVLKRGRFQMLSFAAEIVKGALIDKFLNEG